MKYKRILLKLSGEALMGDKQYGVDNARLSDYAEEIAEIREMGVEVAIVIGGGNIYRGQQTKGDGIDRVQGDYIGMLATVINSMFLQEAIEKKGADAKSSFRHQHRRHLRKDEQKDSNRLFEKRVCSCYCRRYWESIFHNRHSFRIKGSGD